MVTSSVTTLSPYETLYYEDDGMVPNSRFPVLVYHGLEVSGKSNLNPIVKTIEDNGWECNWAERNAIHPFLHYHSTAHELLLVLWGKALVRLGGMQGQIVMVKTGDLIIIPAGVGHQRVSDDNQRFIVMGFYPQGQHWDLLKGSFEEYRIAQLNIPKVPLPYADPLYGTTGPLFDLWK